MITNREVDETLKRAGKMLKARRIRKGLTQKQLAIKACITQKSISFLESGHDHRMSVKIKYLKGLER